MHLVFLHQYHVSLFSLEIVSICCMIFIQMEIWRHWNNISISDKLKYFSHFVYLQQSYFLLHVFKIIQNILNQVLFITGHGWVSTGRWAFSRGNWIIDIDCRRCCFIIVIICLLLYSLIHEFSGIIISFIVRLAKLQK